MNKLIPNAKEIVTDMDTREGAFIKNNKKCLQNVGLNIVKSRQWELNGNKRQWIISWK